MADGALNLHTAKTDDVLVLPTTLAQQRIWALGAHNSGNCAYNVAVRFRLLGPLNRTALERAFNEIVRRHETFRTSFAVVDGKPAQVIYPHLEIQVPLTDLRTLPASERFTRSEQLTVEEAQRGFDLSSAPILRVSLLQIDDNEHILLVTVHQTTCDCWSTGLITQEFGPLYDAYGRGLESPLPDLPIQYGDFAIWQKQWLAEYSQDEQLSYWRAQLTDLPPLEIRPDHPRPPLKTSKGRIESVVLPQSLTNTLKDYSHRESCTFFMLSLAALKLLIQRHTGQDDVYVGTITAGRTKVELEPLIGRFINPLIVRCDLAGDPPFQELLAHVRERVLEALDHRDVPYELVLDALAPPPDPSRNPLFQINFVHQRAFMKPLDIAGITLTPIPSKSAGAMYDLYFFMVERNEGWRFSCEYNVDLYETATINRMLVEYQTILEGIAADPTQRTSQLFHKKTQKVAAPRQSTPAPSPVALAEIVSSPVRSDDIEHRLAKVWEQVLGRSVGPTTDFFDEGGHSVLAARLLVHVEREFGKKLSFAMLLRAPTIRALAARLRESAPTVRNEQVHEIQPSGPRTPFFVVTSQPPLYRPLSRRLGTEQPLMGLTVPEFRALPENFSFHDVAANLIHAMREVQPTGPYYLGGWCVSGIIVYEMAQQLRALDESVRLLAIFDSQCPPYANRLQALRASYPAKLYFKGEKLLHWLNKGWQLGPRAVLGHAWERTRTAHRERRRKLAEWLHPDLASPMGDDFTRMVVHLNANVLTYEPKPYDSPIVLFRSKVLQTGRYRDPGLGWGAFAEGGLDVVETPGEHGEMFAEPAVELLATKLGDNLPNPQRPIAAIGRRIVKANQHQLLAP